MSEKPLILVKVERLDGKPVNKTQFKKIVNAVRQA